MTSNPQGLMLILETLTQALNSKTNAEMHRLTFHARKTLEDLIAQPSAPETRALPSSQERHAIYNALQFFESCRNDVGCRRNPDPTMRKLLQQLYDRSAAPSAVETSPPHPGPSIEKAFAKSPRRLHDDDLNIYKSATT